MAQDQAVQALAEAIALLQEDQNTPPTDDPQQQPEDGNQGTPQDTANEGSGNSDPAQLLQGVRDREAQRREERAQASARQGYEPVEKDW
jgi:hypothetical protein